MRAENAEQLGGAIIFSEQSQKKRVGFSSVAVKSLVERDYDVSWEMGIDSHQRVVAVVVTYNRPRELAALLAALDRQTTPVERIIVVDNGGRQETAEVIRTSPIAEQINGRKNLGAAGGFAYGMLYALAAGADFVWIMDDDGCPARDGVLAGLLAGLRTQNWDAASPLVVDAKAGDDLAFPIRLGLSFFSPVANVRNP